MDNNTPNIADWIAAFAAVAGLISSSAFSYWLWKVSKKQAEISRAQGIVLTRIERAYLRVTCHDDGIEIGDAISSGPEPTAAFVAFVLTIENRGNTPATVTEVIARMIVSKERLDPKLVEKTEQGLPSIAQGYILPGQHLTQRQVPTLAATDVQAFHQGETFIWIAGRVDYVDVFSERRRYGFAYSVEPFPSKTTGVGRHRYSLEMDTTPGLNYDRERKPGEGDYW